MREMHDAAQSLLATTQSRQEFPQEPLETKDLCCMALQTRLGLGAWDSDIGEKRQGEEV